MLAAGKAGKRVLGLIVEERTRVGVERPAGLSTGNPQAAGVVLEAVNRDGG